MLFLRIFSFIAGLALVVVTLYSAVETFVLPRGAPDQFVRTVFLAVRRLFLLRLRLTQNYYQRDRVMAFYAPISLLVLLPAWLAAILIGYMAMYWSIGGTWSDALHVSGSSLFSLGSAAIDGIPRLLLAYSEATIGLILVALLIAYLPTMYAAFSRRETAVTLLEVRAGNPPSAFELIQRYHRIHGLHALSELWPTWEVWFADIEESHTSLAALVFFRSPLPEHSWVTAAGAILDAASLTRSVLDIPADPNADLCIRAGYLALRHISDYFGVAYDPDPHYPATPISVSRQEFDTVCERLAAVGVPLKNDREQAWKDYAGWRVNYDIVLLALAGLTMAPPAPWSSDRATIRHVARFMKPKAHTID